MPPKSQQRQRTPIKGSTTKNARAIMTQRRTQLSNQIRKTKRGHTVTLKRRYVSSPPPPPPTATRDVSEAMSTSEAMTFSNSFKEDSMMSLASSVNSTTMKSVPQFNNASTIDLSGGISSRNMSMVTQGDNKVVELAISYIQSTSSSDIISVEQKLSEFQTALSTSETNLPMESLSAKQENGPIVLLNTLTLSLTQEQSTMQMRLDAARILTNLAASSEEKQDEESYYGQVKQGWCDVILQQSNVVNALITIFSQFITSSSASSSLNEDVINLVEQCAWIVGNLAGESDSIRMNIMEQYTELVEILIQCLLVGFQIAKQAKGGNVVGLCRNVAWALSNLARGVYTSALPFLVQQSAGSGLTAESMAEILLSPELMNEITSGSGGGGGEMSWFNVANEICWLLAFLTAREDEALDKLLFNSSTIGGGQTPILIQSLTRRLSHVCEILSQSNQQQQQQSSTECAVKMCIPLIRCIGNIASGCNGKYVSSLLLTSPTPQLLLSGQSYTTQPITKSLAFLIHCGSSSPSRKGDTSILATEAAWASSTLLCDAGLPPPHPSTTIAVVDLVPSLCTGVTSGYSKLEVKRECISALWNTIAPPPLPAKDGDMSRDTTVTVSNTQDETIQARDEILFNILQFPAGNNEGKQIMIQSLVELCQIKDLDVILPSVRIVNAIYRRFIDSTISSTTSISMAQRRNLQIYFDEAGIVDTLESICDYASVESLYGKGAEQWSSNSGNEEAAEIAANLIDDFYDNEEEEEEQQTCMATTSGDLPSTPFSSMSSVGTDNGRYSFGVADAAAGGGGHAFSFGSPVAPTTAPASGMGRGSGRGQKVIPAWMQQQQK